MLRGLFNEIVRRRLWPIPLIAVIAAVAAPILFLKSSPSAGPAPAASAQASPAASEVEQLPVRAQRLLDANAEPEAKATKRTKADDPFAAPASTGASKSDGASASPSAGSAVPAPSSGGDTTATQEPVPVVITDEDGKTKDDSTTTDKTSSAKSSQSSGSSGHVAVDIRFGTGTDGSIRRDVARLKPLVANGRLVASFVKYSPSRNKATFAISPTTYVRGSTECRMEDDQCRYVDVSAGKHVLLSIAGPNNTAITRRLSVVRIREASGSEPRRSLGGQCLLSKLAKLEFGDPPVLADACG